MKISQVLLEVFLSNRCSGGWKRGEKTNRWIFKMHLNVLYATMQNIICLSVFPTTAFEYVKSNFVSWINSVPASLSCPFITLYLFFLIIFVPSLSSPQLPISAKWKMIASSC